MLGVAAHAGAPWLLSDRCRCRRAWDADAGPCGNPGKHPAGRLRIGLRQHRRARRAPAHRLHRGLRLLLRQSADERLPRALPAYLPGHPAGAALRQPVAARGGHHHYPRAPGARPLCLLAAVRLPPAPVRHARLPGQPRADPQPRRPGRACLRRLRRGPGLQLQAALPQRPAARRAQSPAQYQRGRPVPRGPGRPRAGHSALFPRRPRRYCRTRWR